ncbi:hypothetical protein LOD99_9624 [Oopsacas minuta]|uniref:Uncharacterized protein n=1 Tax=Oopsacas minuta TaxID=111878 RepID=A0AAV7KKP8_9METZ|nr:hypothetical protein LOD99_9609 [Oopsacas minuta]KAI6662037.1 hypothetical protein LOD99_9624 [Oopsacas minuta]
MSSPEISFTHLVTMETDPQRPLFYPFPSLSMESHKLRALMITVDYVRELVFLYDEDRQIHTFNKQLQHLNQFKLNFHVESITTAPDSNLIFLKQSLCKETFIQVVDMFSGSLVTSWKLSSCHMGITCDSSGNLYTCDYLNSRIKIFDMFEPVSTSFTLSPMNFQLTPYTVKLAPDKFSILVQNLEPAFFFQVYDLCGNLLKTFSNNKENYVRDSFTTANMNCAIVCIHHELHFLDQQSDTMITLGGFGRTIGSFIRPFAIAFLPPDLFIICNESVSYPIQCLNFQPF